MTLFPAGLGSFTNNCDHITPHHWLVPLSLSLSALGSGHVWRQNQSHCHSHCHIVCSAGAGVMDTIDISNAQMLRFTIA